MAGDILFVFQVAGKLQLTKHRGGKLDLCARSLAEVIGQRVSRVSAREGAAATSSIKSHPVDGVQVLGEHLFALHVVHLHSFRGLGELLIGSSRVLALGVVEALENDLPEKVGYTNDRVVILVGTVCFEDFLADHRFAQTQDGILFRGEVVEEGTRGDARLLGDFFNGGSAHPVFADAFEGCFVDCRPGLFAAAFAKALFLFLHNCNYFITAHNAQVHFWR